MAGSTQTHLVSVTLIAVSRTVRSDIFVCHFPQISGVIFRKYLARFHKYLAIPQIFGGPDVKV